MVRKFFILFVAGILFVALLFNWTSVQAQSTSELIPIPVALSSENYGSTYHPADLTQSDDPTIGRGIVGADNRTPVTAETFPWSAIGRIDWVINGEEHGKCTGTLIGRDLVLTNSHCLFYNDPQNNQFYRINQIVFKPNMIGNDFVDKATVVERVPGWDSNFNGYSDDWALLRIDRTLGDKYGYLGWRELDFSDPSVLSSLHDQVRLAGYSGDYPTRKQREANGLEGEENQTAGVHIGCNIEGSSEGLGIAFSADGTGRYGATDEQAIKGLIIHNCDTTGGASGSTILAKFDDGNYYIIGIHAGWNLFDESTLPTGSSREICRITKYDDEGDLIYDPEDDLVYDSVGICRNRAVQASRWATQAAAMRTSS